MKYSFGLAAVAAAACVVADSNSRPADVVAYANATDADTVSVPRTPINTTNVFAPALAPGVDTHGVKSVVPQTNVSLFYGSNLTSSASVNVKHTMKYPTVLLEQIASIINVDCFADSVAMTFNNSGVFATTQTAWTADGIVVFITNHLGNCDPELERGFFLATSLSFDNATLIATASSAKANISSIAATTEITFGNIPTAEISKRGLTTTLDPSFTLNPAIALTPDTVLYSYSPYLTVTANEASFASNVTVSGYLKYNWLTFSLNDLYFDIDVGFSSALGLTAVVGASYNQTFTYSPSPLYYGLTVPGVIELGPELIFAIDVEVYASAETTLSTQVGVGLADGNVHVDLLDESNTSTSGWVPTYSASASITGSAEAQLNPTASLTVEIECKIFGGLIDLSTGLTAKPSFTNDFKLTGGAGVDLTGYEDLTGNGTCEDGLAIDSEFAFVLDAFATEWYSTELYSVDLTIFKGCFNYQS